MTQPSPADELRAAVTALRTAADDAEAASPGPWAITSERVIRCSDDEASIVADRSCADPGEDADLPYITLMHPGVGHALAQWLDSWTGIDLYEAGSLPEDARHALAVARAITGNQP